MKNEGLLYYYRLCKRDGRWNGGLRMTYRDLQRSASLNVRRLVFLLCDVFLERCEEEPNEQQFILGIPKTDATTDSTSNQANNGTMVRFEEPSEQELLSGIPDHITEDIITRKLPWRTLRILASVSRRWNEAFQSCIDARLRSIATETNVVLQYYLCGSFKGVRPIYGNVLYTLSDAFWYDLPRIPNVGTGDAGTGFTEGSVCVFLSGRVYCLGGDQYDSNSVRVRTRDEVYVMDLAGQRQWQQCKSMPHARRWTDCYGRVLANRGKIYVQNSRHDEDFCHFRDNFRDVYDPESNTWDLIEEPLSPFRTVPGLQEALTACIRNFRILNTVVLGLR